MSSDAADLLAAEDGAIAHMNADHADACRLYATRLLGAPDGDWRCVGIDPDGIELQNGRHCLAAAISTARHRPRTVARCFEATGGTGAGARRFNFPTV